MIQANELRIGNWISFKGMWEGEVEKFTSSSVTIKNNPGFFDIESFEGVELEDKVFSLAGFKHGFVNKNWEIYTLSDIEFSKMKDGFYQTGRVKIKYLHQLQNLYFALTGQELEVNLTAKTVPQ